MNQREKDLIGCYKACLAGAMTILVNEGIIEMDEFNQANELMDLFHLLNETSERRFGKPLVMMMSKGEMRSL